MKSVKYLIRSQKTIKTHFNFSKLFEEMKNMKFFNGYIKENNDNYDLVEVEFIDPLERDNLVALAQTANTYRFRHICMNGITKQSFHFGKSI